MKLVLKSLLWVVLIVVLLVALLLVALGVPSTRTWLLNKGVGAVGDYTPWKVVTQEFNSPSLGEYHVGDLKLFHNTNPQALLHLKAFKLSFYWRELLDKRLHVQHILADSLWVDADKKSWPVGESEPDADEPLTPEALEQMVNEWVDKLANVDPAVMPPVVIDNIAIGGVSAALEPPAISKPLAVQASINGKANLPNYNAALDITVAATHGDTAFPRQNVNLELTKNTNAEPHLSLTAAGLSATLLRSLSGLEFTHDADLTLQLYVAKQPNRVELERADIRYGEGTIGAEGTLLNAVFDGQLRVTDFPLAWAPLSLPEPVNDLTLDNAKAKLDVHVPIAYPLQATAKGDVAVVGALKSRPLHVSATADYGDFLATIDQAKLTWDKSHVSVGGSTINLAEDAVSPLDVKNTSAYFPLRYLALLGIQSPMSQLDFDQGYVKVNDVSVTGKFDQPDIAAKAQAKVGFEGKDLHLDSELAATLEQVHLEHADIRWGDTTLAAKGDAHIADETVAMSVKLDQVDTRQFPSLLGELLGKNYVTGNLKADVNGSWYAPVADMQIRANGRYEASAIEASLQAAFDQNRLTLKDTDVVINAQDKTAQPLKFSANADVQGIDIKAISSGAMDPSTLATKAEFAVAQADLKILKALGLEPLYNTVLAKLSNVGERYYAPELGVFKGDVKLSLDKSKLQTQGNLSLEQPMSDRQIRDRQRQAVEPLKADIQWNTPDSEVLGLDALIQGLGVNAAPFLSLKGTTDLAPVRTLVLDSLAGKDAVFDKLNASADGFVDFALLQLFLDNDVQKISGQMNVNLAVSGKPEKPDLQGDIELKSAAFSDRMLGVSTNNIAMNIAFKNQLATVTKGLIEFEESGNVTITGNADWGKELLDLGVKINRASLVNQAAVQGLFSGGIDIKGALLTPDVKGEITINSLDVNLDQLAMSSVDRIDVTKVNTLDEKPEPPAAKGEAPYIDIKVNAANNMSIRGYGMDAELGGTVGVRGKTHSIETIGSFNLIRGQVEWLSQRFILSDVNVALANSAVSLLVKGSADVDDYTYNIDMTGTIDDMDIKLSSVPALPDDEILARIMFGKPIQQMTAVQAIRLAAAVNSLRSGGPSIVNSQREKLGLDALSIDQEETNNEGSGVSVGFGKYITDKTYVQVKRIDNPEKPWKARIEHQLNDNVSAEAYTGGKSGFGGVELNWKHNY